MILAQQLVKRFGVGWRSLGGDGPLHIAAKRNRPELVAWILGQPELAGAMDARNVKGETPLLVATRLFRGVVALRLVEALADPGAADEAGEAPEALDLDGLLHEAERDEAYARRAEQDRTLVAVAAARRAREDAAWRERLFEETGVDEPEPFTGYDDLEQHDAETDGRNWMDQIAFEAQERARAEARARAADRMREALRAQEEARARAEVQEAKAREAAEADAASGAGGAGFGGRAKDGGTASRDAGGPASELRGAAAEEPEEARLAARAADETRWRTFEERVASLAAGAVSAAEATGAAAAGLTPLRPSEIPWPSGPPHNPLRIDPRGHPAVVRSQLRAGLLRWHPDKFAQRVGRFVAVGGEALTRAKSIAQQLNRLMADLAPDPRAAPAPGPAAA